MRDAAFFQSVRKNVMDFAFLRVEYNAKDTVQYLAKQKGIEILESFVHEQDETACVPPRYFHHDEPVVILHNPILPAQIRLHANIALSVCIMGPRYT